MGYSICLRCAAQRIMANMRQVKFQLHTAEFRRKIVLSSHSRNEANDSPPVDSLTEWEQGNYGEDMERRFIDWVKIKVRGGNGGNGMVHLKRGKRLLGPDGGDGGKGGDIIVEADQSKKSLRGVKWQYNAENGGKGKTDFHRGKNGRSITIKVPVGTVIKAEGCKEVVADLTMAGSTLIVAAGGVGGMGNANFKSSTNQRPEEATPGVAGEEATIELEMKSIADVGLVGFPNAGKSTLLRALSRAKPAVAAYPFTTLKPNIGIIQYKDMVQVAVADIPGLVEGAHINRGLGHSFLRHIERCSSLLYVIDLSDDLYFEKYRILKDEVRLYNEDLLKLPAIVVANKIDIVKECTERIEMLQENMQVPVIGISGRNLMNTEQLKIEIRKLVSKVKVI